MDLKIVSYSMLAFDIILTLKQILYHTVLFLLYTSKDHFQDPTTKSNDLWATTAMLHTPVARTWKPAPGTHGLELPAALRATSRPKPNQVPTHIPHMPLINDSSIWQRVLLYRLFPAHPVHTVILFLGQNLYRAVETLRPSFRPRGTEENLPPVCKTPFCGRT